MPSAWMIRSVVSWKASRPPSCCIRRTRKLWRVFWGRWVSSMSSRRAWCQSRLNISLRRWTPRTVCTARLGRPLSTQYMGAKRSSSIRGSASFRKTSAQLLSRRLAFFGVTRNWDCQRLSCGSRIRNILPSLGQAQRPRPFITLSPPCPRLARGFYEQIFIALIPFDDILDTDLSVSNAMNMIFSGGIVTPEAIQTKKIDLDELQKDVQQ